MSTSVGSTPAGSSHAVRPPVEGRPADRWPVDLSSTAGADDASLFVDRSVTDTQEIDLREIRSALAQDADRQEAPQEAPQEAAQEPAAGAPRQRDRYIDTLRAVALVRVVTYHAFGWAWLPLLFPSMGIMFALAGSLVAGSLDRSPGNPWRVLRKRTTRLLPPVWLFGLVVVPVMLLAGWTHTAEAGSPLHPRTLLLWVLPISDPPGSALGEDWVLPLWYIRTYLWFLLLSPMVLWLFRHWPKRMLALPVAAVGLWTVGLLPMDGRSGDVLLSLGTFGACWMLGFAHHDGSLRRIPALTVVAGGVALMGLGLAYALTHPDPATGYDIDNIPLADMLYCLGAVLVLLRLYPDFSWMARHRFADRLVAVFNSRAMTIYLWGNLAIFLSHPLLDSWSVTADLDQDTWVGATQAYLASWLVLVACVLAFGWCEDLAARRPVRFNPWPRTPGQLSVLRQLRTFSAPGAVRSRVTPARLAIGTTALVVTATALSALVLVGTRTPARTTAGDVQSRVAVQPRPEVSRSDVAPVPTPATLTPAPVLPPDGGAGGGAAPRAQAAPRAWSPPRDRRRTARSRARRQLGLLAAAPPGGGCAGRPRSGARGRLDHDAATDDARCPADDDHAGRCADDGRAPPVDLDAATGPDDDRPRAGPDDPGRPAGVRPRTVRPPALRSRARFDRDGRGRHGAAGPANGRRSPPAPTCRCPDARQVPPAGGPRAGSRSCHAPVRAGRAPLASAGGQATGGRAARGDPARRGGRGGAQRVRPHPGRRRGGGAGRQHGAGVLPLRDQGAAAVGSVRVRGGGRPRPPRARRAGPWHVHRAAARRPAALPARPATPPAGPSTSTHGPRACGRRRSGPPRGRSTGSGGRRSSRSCATASPRASSAARTRPPPRCGSRRCSTGSRSRPRCGSASGARRPPGGRPRARPARSACRRRGCCCAAGRGADPSQPTTGPDRAAGPRGRAASDQPGQRRVGIGERPPGEAERRQVGGRTPPVVARSASTRPNHGANLKPCADPSPTTTSRGRAAGRRRSPGPG